ncbi:MAG: hypothetical protein KDD64_12585 [Bdellovibrionales bacterium]|nr:hypothetical protein [Bdellovibrionales bacterium]
MKIHQLSFRRQHPVLLFALGLFLSHAQALAQISTAEMLARCDPEYTFPDTKLDQLHCYGYVQGLFEAYQETLRGPLVPLRSQLCFSDSTVDIRELVEYLVVFAKLNPDRLSQPAKKLVLDALRDRFSCLPEGSEPFDPKNITPPRQPKPPVNPQFMKK